ncbi:MAG: glycosyltransferase family 39 protein [Candidatus Binatia bacterium]
MISLVRYALRGALAAAVVAIYKLLYDGSLSEHRAFALNIVALTALVLSLYRPAAVPARRPVPWRGQAALLLVLAIGAAARIVGFEHFPPPNGQLWEEAQTGSVAFESITADTLDPIFPLVNLVAEAGFRLLGVSMTSLRLPFLVLAVLAVPIFYLAARQLLTTRAAALLATLLFATSPFLAVAGRVALETMSPTFTLCLALAATFYAMRTGTYASFALAGLTNGLLLTEYFSFRVVPVLAFGCLALTAMRRPAGAPGAGSRPHRIAQWVGPLTFLAFCAAVLMPIWIQHADAAVILFEGIRRHSSGIAAGTAQLDFAGKTLAALQRAATSASYVFLPDGGADLLPDWMGILDPATGLLGLVALLYCTRSAVRRPEHLFLAATVLSIAVLSGALVGNPARYRLAPIVPFYLLAIGVLADALCAGRGWRRGAAIALGVGACAIALRNLHLLYFQVLPNAQVREQFYDTSMILALEAGALQAVHPGARLYLITDLDFLGGSSDYAFLYDPTRVRVVPNASALAGSDGGYAVAYDGFAPMLDAFAGRWECQHTYPWPGRGALLTCRLPDGRGVR